MADADNDEKRGHAHNELLFVDGLLLGIFAPFNYEIEQIVGCALAMFSTSLGPQIPPADVVDGFGLQENDREDPELYKGFKENELPLWHFLAGGFSLEAEEFAVSFNNAIDVHRLDLGAIECWQKKIPVEDAIEASGGRFLEGALMSNCHGFTMINPKSLKTEANFSGLPPK